MTTTTGSSAEQLSEVELAAHQRELLAYCYRMLGSPLEAQDAVQETLTKAWRSSGRFDASRGSLRTWLYAIATNVCLDLLRGRERRVRAMDVAAAATPGDPLGDVLPPDRWIEPIPDALVTSPDDDPGAVIAIRESVRLALVAALQHLPARQRAVLILREVLGFHASEVAELLSTTVAAVNSALQRARSTISGLDLTATDPVDPSDPDQRRMLESYVAAFEHQDVDTLVTLLAEDVAMSMPPLLWWLRGKEHLAAVWRADPAACAGTRMIPTVANGSPAFAQYVWSDALGRHEPRSLTVLELVGGRIRHINVFLDTATWYPLFGFPLDRVPGGAARA